MPVLSNAWITASQIAAQKAAEAGQEDAIATPAPTPAPTPEPTPEPAVALVNVNTAGITQLRGLTGIGDASAKRIIEARKIQPFEGLNDLLTRADLSHITDTAALEAAIAF